MDAWMGVHIHIEPFYATTLTLAYEELPFGYAFFMISFPALGLHRATDGETASMFSLASS